MGALMKDLKFIILTDQSKFISCLFKNNEEFRRQKDNIEVKALANLIPDNNTYE